MSYLYPMKRALLLQRKLHHALALVLAGHGSLICDDLWQFSYID